MTISLGVDGAITLADACGAEDAEALLLLLLDHPDADLDWRGCTAAHTGVVQLLLVARRPLRGPPQNLFLAQWVEPLLRGR